MKRVIRFTLAAVAAAILAGCSVANTETKTPDITALVNKPVAEVSDCLAEAIQNEWPNANFNQRRDGSMRAVISYDGFVEGIADVKAEGKAARVEMRARTQGVKWSFDEVMKRCG